MAGIEKEAKVKHTYLKSLPSSFSYLEDFFILSIINLYPSK